MADLPEHELTQQEKLQLALNADSAKTSSFRGGDKNHPRFKLTIAEARRLSQRDRATRAGFTKVSFFRDQVEETN